MSKGQTMNLQQLMSLGLILLMLHPAMQPGGAAKAQERTIARQPLLAAARRPAASPMAPKKVTPKVAPQVSQALAGQSSTLLPDGSTLVLGGAGLSGSTA